MHFASVAVAVANVWVAPGTATIRDDPHLWSKLSYSQRLVLVGRMPTQALFGERVVVLARRGIWTKIAIPDQPTPLDRRGYPGWMRTAQLERTSTSPTEMVTVSTARLRNGVEVGLGSVVPLGSAPAKVLHRLPHTRADLVRTAKAFVGLHYLWGGLSSWGYDCSGLMWAAYRVHGITIPRDADAQYAAGMPVSLAAAKPGDLIFYDGARPDHVAMLVGRGMMIESPNSASAVRIAPIRSGYVGLRRFM